jgi:succinate dehydrogenase / fumarate reductase cytochrome b subunit
MAGQRPLSPHLQIYRPQLTSMLSIVHRATGVWLCAGAAMVAWFVIALAEGVGAYSQFVAFTQHWFGKLIVISFVFSTFYHLCNGIRHLVWDAGKALSIKAVNLGGWITLLASLTLTALTVLVFYQRMRGAL